MTISILIRDTAKGQKIARPFNRAVNCDEAEEMLEYYRAATKAAEAYDYDWRNIGTDEPVVAFGTQEFFAFVE